VDSTTGEVVASERIRGQAGKVGVKVGYAGSNFGGDLGAFAKTPLGQAAQDCINQAVKFIATQMEDRSIEGAVVGNSGEAVIINLGENYGVSTGQKFVVRTEGEVLTDPTTGAVLDKLEGAVTATIAVAQVREKTAHCTLIDGEMPQRGQVVVLKQ
jgi:hypothetical protein